MIWLNFIAIFSERFLVVFHCWVIFKSSVFKVLNRDRTRKCSVTFWGRSTAIALFISNIHKTRLPKTLSCHFLGFDKVEYRNVHCKSYL